MRFIAPPFQGHHVIVARNQEEYLEVPAMIIPLPMENGQWTTGHLLCLDLSLEERLRIAEGERLYIMLMSFQGPMQPILPIVGTQQVQAALHLNQESPNSPNTSDDPGV